ncbi:MAG: Fic family protein [Ligilactobacillus animalis]|uniref:Fic family protein n=1 Tax=Ligilactobacillus TaxID=2767887 RepID=UPI0009F8F31F|nr:MULTISPECIES: Fic family protein [Ligilactobacillus]MCI5942058.1 Fic family protein [Ligilactobacillus animalis]MDY2993373.1 Fic family protein [Ligilactobacillus animalis]
MGEYQSLRVYSYSNIDDVESEFRKRLDGYTTIRTNLKINPVLRGERQREEFELFALPLPEINILLDKITQNSKEIKRLVNLLPGIASVQFSQKSLVEEVYSTNEIEGVYTTRQEIDKAIQNVADNSKQKVRLKSLVYMYSRILDGNKMDIENLEDIRHIYDKLLSDEIDKDKLPDGNLFRDRAVQIGNDTKVVHVPKARESDFVSDLTQWVTFINKDEIPFIYKTFIAHYYFEYIHPFSDGNGRLGRYIACVYLAHKLDPLTAISFSREIGKAKKKYYQSFQEVSNPKNYGEVTFFVKDMMELLHSGQKEIINQLNVDMERLSYVDKKLKNSTFTKIQIGIIFILLQAYLFNSKSASVKDNEVKEVLTDFKKVEIRRELDYLERKGYIKKVKKRPLARSVTDKLVEILDI